MQTLLIGVDGACRSVLDPMFETSDLPNFRGIFEDGVSGALTSQIPPLTPSAWPSLFTGVNPGRHGVFGFLAYDGYEWEVVNRTHVREYALWEILDWHGISSVVVNVPVTHPPRPFEGAIIPGYVAPQDPACFPQGLLQDVRVAIGDYTVYDEESGRSRSDEERIEGYLELIRMRGEAFRYLADRFDPEFGFVQFQQTDTVCHECPGALESIETGYQAVDEQVGRIIAECDPDNVLVVSDHGIGEYGGYEFRVNAFLRDHGYVETERGGGMPSWSTLARQQLRGGDGDPRGRNRLEWAVTLAARTGLTSQRIAGLLETVGLDGFVAEHVPPGLVRAATEKVDFSASKAYMRSRIELGVRINLEGREPDGVVSQDEYEGVRSELVSLLGAARTPDDRPVFETVAPREEFLEGAHVPSAADVIVVPAEFDQYLVASLRAATFDDPSPIWNHKLEGIFAAVGPRIYTDGSLDGAHVFDVAPTVLATFDVPVGEHFDGAALPVVDSPPTATYPEFLDASAVATNEPQVERQPSDLGYLE